MSSRASKPRPSLFPADLKDDIEELRAKPGQARPQPAFHEIPVQAPEPAPEPESTSSAAVPATPVAPISPQQAPAAPLAVVAEQAIAPPVSAPLPVPVEVPPQPVALAPVLQAGGGEGRPPAIDLVAQEKVVVSTGGDIKARAVNLTVYLLPDDHKRLRRLSVERDTSIQALVMDGIDHVFRGADLAPVQRWEPKRKVRN